MNLTEEQLENIEILAGLFMSPAFIATSLDISFADFDEFEEALKFKNDSPIYQRYHRGRITAEIELRMAIKQAALNGSNPAQTTMTDYFNETKL